MCFFKNWNNKLAFNFAPSYHKNSKNDTCLLFDGFDLKVIIFKKLVLLRKKIIFRIWKKYSKGTLLFQNLKSYIFVFLTLFDFKTLEVYFELCLFFSWIKINFAIQKALAEFFLVKPWPLQQPPEAKLLTSVCFY